MVAFGTADEDEASITFGDGIFGVQELIRSWVSGESGCDRERSCRSCRSIYPISFIRYRSGQNFKQVHKS